MRTRSVGLTPTRPLSGTATTTEAPAFVFQVSVAAMPLVAASSQVVAMPIVAAMPRATQGQF
jgi:hypothetical protein